MTRRTQTDRRSQPRIDGDRRAPTDRRRGNRVPLSLEVAVPVVVRSDDGVQRGLARNISEGGMLIEMNELPPIGSPLEITFAGLTGSCAVTLYGEVRHQVAWQHASQGRPQTMRGIGVRFVEGRQTNERLPAVGDWVH